LLGFMSAQFLYSSPSAGDGDPRTLAVRNGLTEHLPSLRAHAFRRARSRQEASDIVQEAALRALTFAWSFDPGTNVRAWLHQVLESVFMSQCRKRTRERRAFEALGRDPCAWTQKDATPAMLALSPRVGRALEALPAGFRDAVQLVDIEELPYRDAAERLSVPVGTVMSRLFRGRRLLASALSENEAVPAACAA
jgi:RNA polymerase sigma-70 factor (ECF subfamily)